MLCQTSMRTDRRDASIQHVQLKGQVMKHRLLLVAIAHLAAAGAAHAQQSRSGATASTRSPAGPLRHCRPRPSRSTTPGATASMSRRYRAPPLRPLRPSPPRPRALYVTGATASIATDRRTRPPRAPPRSVPASAEIDHVPFSRPDALMDPQILWCISPLDGCCFKTSGTATPMAV